MLRELGCILAILLLPCPVLTGHFSSRIISTGLSEASRKSVYLPWSAVGLNGSGVVIAVADTGIDHRHCQFAEGPAPWPCYNRLSGSDGAPNRPSECSASKFVGFLCQDDLRAFAEAFTSTSLDLRLLDSGSTAGVPSPRPPLDVELEATLGSGNAQQTAREKRETMGYVFQLGSRNQTLSIIPMLNLMAAVRGTLHDTLVHGHTIIREICAPICVNRSICSLCVGKTSMQDGLQVGHVASYVMCVSTLSGPQLTGPHHLTHLHTPRSCRPRQSTSLTRRNVPSKCLRRLMAPSGGSCRTSYFKIAFVCWSLQGAPQQRNWSQAK